MQLYILLTHCTKTNTYLFSISIKLKEDQRVWAPGQADQLL